MTKNYERLKNIIVIPYDEETKGIRRCNTCLATTKEETERDKIMGTHHTDKLFELIIGGGNGGFEIVLCKDCLKELKDKIEQEIEK